MAIYSPRLWWVAIALLLWAPHTHCREYTHEDIRDAMLSLVHMIRMSEDKQERHDLREKSLGEQVKKMLNNLDKKHRALEPLIAVIFRLDERLSNVETILLQKEEREKSSQNKINEVLGNIQQTLVTLVPAPKVSTELDNSLTVNEDLQRTLNATDAKIDAVNKEIINLKNSLNPMEEREKSSQNKINEVLRNIQQTLVTLVPAPKESTQLDNSLTVNDDLQRRLNATDAKIDAVNKEIINLKNSLNPMKESEKSSQNKINEVLGNIQETLITLIPAPKESTELDNSLTVNDDLQRRLNATDAKIDAVNKEIINLKNSLNPMKESEKSSQNKINEVLGNIQETLITLIPAPKESTELDNSLTVNDDLQRRLNATDAKIDAVNKEIINLKNSLNPMKESEKSSQNKINEVLGNIQETLITLIPAPKESTELDNSLTVNDVLQRRLNATDAKIDAVNKEIINLKNSLNPEALRAMCLDVASDMNPLEKHISEAEKLLSKYERKLNDYNGTTDSVQTDFRPLKEVAAADDAWHSKISVVMERQEQDIKKVQRLLSDAESMWKDLPRLADLHRLTNQTLEALSNATGTTLHNIIILTTKVETKVREMGDKLGMTNEDIQRSLTQSNTMTEQAFSGISRSYDSLRAEVQLLSKSDLIIQETSENVLYTKKRLDDVFNQIIMQLADVIRGQHKIANKTADMKLDGLQLAITNNQTLALHKFSSTFDIEMSTVWRQIGIIHQKIRKSQQAIIKLSENSEQYVNISTTTMDKVKNEVNGINTKVIYLKENMNFVLGELYIVTQKFQTMASELNKTLNSINNNATDVPRIADAGPGPHNITGET